MRAISAGVKVVRASGGGFSGNGCVNDGSSPVDAVNRFARFTVEDEHQALFRDLRDGRNRLAISLHVNEHRGRVEIVVPHIVMRRLEVPLLFARRRIERHERIAIEICSRSIAAVVVVGETADWQEHDAASDIDCHQAPDVSTGSVLPGIALPHVVAGLARSRNGVECPQQFSGARTPGTHITRWTECGLLLHMRSRDHDVLEEHGRRREAVVGLREIVAGTGAQIDRAALTERLGRCAGLCVK